MEFASKSANPIQPPAKPRIGVRVAVFAFIEIITLMLLGPLLMPWAGPLITGATTSFVAAALANAMTLRIYERGRLADIGLGFSSASWKNAAIGFIGGLGAVAICAGLPLLFRLASLEPAPEQPRNIPSFIFVSVILLFGAIGEEMLFRGYGFQLLLHRWGAFSTILPVGVLFAWAHSNNPGMDSDVAILALVNTFLWGVLFGLCFLRSGDLWLSIGVHFGWNWTLPLFGVNVSGFPMSVTGYKMIWSAAPLWSGGGYGLEASLFTLLVLPLIGWYLWKAPVIVQKPFLLRDTDEDEEAEA